TLTSLQTPDFESSMSTIPPSGQDGFFICLVVSIYENPSKNQLILYIDCIDLSDDCFFIVFLSNKAG
ncbi:MAG: hypothetical protein WCJ45_04415, partial [bacterium]